MVQTRAPPVAFVCICLLLSANCGGGGGTDQGVGPNTSGSGGGASPSDVPKPELTVELQADGSAYLRVSEQSYDVFAPAAAQRLVRNQQLGPSPGQNNVISGPETTLIANVDIVRMKYGLTLQDSATVSIFDYSFIQEDGGGQIYGGAIKLGDNKRPTNGEVFIARVYADGMQLPDGSYKERNTDFLGIEADSGPVYVRDVTGKNFGDAGIDSKSTQIYVMNATLQSGHRMLRAWPGVEITLVNSIVNAAPGETQGWIQDATASIRYYNTLWCEAAENPSPSDPNCRTTPWLIEGEDMNYSLVAPRFIGLASNPLPGIKPFFKTEIDEIILEYSSDGGRKWQLLSVQNTGGPGSAPLGDPRYKVPLDLAAAEYTFRARYRKDGRDTGVYSVAVNEAGQPAG